MRLSLSWLGEYLDGAPPATELAGLLTMSGLETEVLRQPAQGLDGKLVIVRILEVAAHPNADRLSLCRVDDGRAVHEVVCGADNMAAGDLAVLVCPGAQLPGGAKIKKARIRGVESAGMLCSEAELGVSDRSAGIIILSSGEPGDSAVELFGLDETILETAVTPNRGDCLSVRGLAREAAAVCGLTLTAKFAEKSMRPTGSSEISVHIEDEAACSMYRGLLVEGLSPGLSPPWLVKRLSGAGLGSVNSLVDVTNLLLIELGQPLHAFDADRIEGGIITVRRLGSGDKFEALDGEKYELSAGDLVIADAQGPVALAGVMGGQRTAVGTTTERVFLESAVFDPVAVRRTSRRLGLVSESSYRFERGIDPAMVEETLLRAGALLGQLAGGQVVGGVAEAGKGPARRERITLRKERLAAVLAEDIDIQESCSILSALGAGVEPEQDSVVVDVPSHRHDLVREIDLIEEVARVRGYDRIPAQWPRIAMEPALLPPALVLRGRLRERLVAVGMTETVVMAFSSADANRFFPGLHDPALPAVVIVNPIRSGEEEMRRSLLPALIEAQKQNLRNGSRVVDIFACGQTHAGGMVCTEVPSVAGLLHGPRRDRGPGDTDLARFWDAKGAVESLVPAAGVAADGLEWTPTHDNPGLHPRAAATISLAGRLLGYAGLIHPDAARSADMPEATALFELDCQALLACASPGGRMRPLARFPSVVRDLSLVVGQDTLAAEVYRAVAEVGEGLVETVRCFDEYVGEGVEEGAKALAFSITYRSADRTLTDEEVSRAHEKLVLQVIGKLGARVRA